MNEITLDFLVKRVYNVFMNIYYVYAYLRKSDLTPYYIGMGSKKRAWDRSHCVKVPTDLSRIIIVETLLTRIGAAAIERRLIQWYGRKIDRSGILRNIGAGGEGGAGNYLRRSPSDKTKQKISDSLTGRKIGPPSQDHKDKIRDALTGKVRPTFSDEWKRNIGKAGKGRRPPNAGKQCWNNGRDNIFSVDSPGPDWVEGMFRAPYLSSGSRGMSWWNNGRKNKLSKESPGSEFILGRLPFSRPQ